MSNDPINIFCDTINAFSKGLRSQLSSDGYKDGDVVYDRLDSIDAQVTALRQHQQDGGWLPIESAPRDGTPFLAYVKKTHSGLMPKNRVFRISLTKKGWCCGNNYFNESQLTHWQPLPPAPKKENDDA